ncbi:MAG: M43 family zinc metalloprotease [Bacteroidota bacterium]
MKKIVLPIFLSLLFTSYSFSQKFNKCITHEMFLEQIKNDPQFLENQQNLEIETHEFTAHQNQNRSAAAVKIIPVVFHVVHEYGNENISRAQILDQLRTLNEDFRRLNPDTVNTPQPFKSISGDTEIEFRLATLDPNGNCTDGINRLYSPLTNNARDNIKALVTPWPRNKYLNVWVVKSIENSSGSAGTVLGYAQFPGGSAATDGIVLRSDRTGSIGTSNDGRTMTHEIGHWLNLRHIWGDATCGNDQVSDTPVHNDANSGCPQFPHLSSNCSGSNANGDMFTNYMDYSNGTCMNQFSIGQGTRMNAALTSSTSGRNNLSTSANLISTGTTTVVTPNCAPVADFTPFLPTLICPGTSVTFNDETYRATPTSYSWSFPGGTPSTSTEINPVVVYNTPGTYQASLTVSNAVGSNTFSRQSLIIVAPENAQENDTLTQGFELQDIPNDKWLVVNRTVGSKTFVRTSTSKFAGTFSAFVDNFNNTDGDIDELISPTFDFTNIDSLSITYKYAYAQRTTSAASSNRLQVYLSNECGKTWTLRSNSFGTSLATVAAQNTAFYPTLTAQWKNVVVPNITAFANGTSVRIKFVFTSGDGNNLFIDNIQINGNSTTSIQEINLENVFSIQPNPTQGIVKVTSSKFNGSINEVSIVNLLGKQVYKINSIDKNTNLNFDLSEFSDGIYFLQIKTNKGNLTKKIVLTK